MLGRVPERTMTVEQNVLQQHSQKVRLHQYASLRARLGLSCLRICYYFRLGVFSGAKSRL